MSLPFRRSSPTKRDFTRVTIAASLIPSLALFTPPESLVAHFGGAFLGFLTNLFRALLALLTHRDGAVLGRPAHLLGRILRVVEGAFRARGAGRAIDDDLIVDTRDARHASQLCSARSLLPGRHGPGKGGDAALDRNPDVLCLERPIAVNACLDPLAKCMVGSSGVGILGRGGAGRDRSHQERKAANKAEDRGFHAGSPSK